LLLLLLLLLLLNVDAFCEDLSSLCFSASGLHSD